MVPSLEVRDLRLMMAIAECGGATRAARVLSLSQSAVSHQLRNLEERLGCRLFERSGKRLIITAAGERLVKLGAEVLKPITLAEQEIRRGATGERLLLRVATQCYTAFHWLPSAISVLSAEHPHVELVLTGEAPADFAAALDACQLELGLCVSPPRATRLERVRLFEDELVLVVPRGHQLAKQAFASGADLGGETLIMNQIASPERERVRKALFPRGEKPAKVMRVPFSEAIIELVSAGLGVSIMAGFTLQRAVRRGDVETVRLTRGGIRRSWTAVFRRNTRVDAAVRLLIEAVKRQHTSGR